MRSALSCFLILLWLFWEVVWVCKRCLRLFYRLRNSIRPNSSRKVCGVLWYNCETESLKAVHNAVNKVVLFKAILGASLNHFYVEWRNNYQHFVSSLHEVSCYTMSMQFDNGAKKSKGAKKIRGADASKQVQNLFIALTLQHLLWTLNLKRMCSCA